MIIITAVEDRNGLLFNHRRLSQDRVLRARMLERTAGRCLWMNAYSAKQFEQTDGIRIAEDFLARAGAGDFCFVETEHVLPYLDRIEGILLYRWNRRYPADLYFDLDVTAAPWVLKETFEFPGSSHPAITEEVYTRA